MLRKLGRAIHEFNGNVDGAQLKLTATNSTATAP
jgi:hypothetical protein